MARIKHVEWRGNQVLVEIDKDCQANLKIVAEAIAVTARRKCPVLNIEKGRSYARMSTRLGQPLKSWMQRVPGRLRDSIKVMKSKYRGGGYIVIAGDYDTFYARFVELGVPAYKPKYKRQPFLRPALENHKRTLKNIFGAK